MKRYLVTIPLLILCVLFFSSGSSGCSMVRLETFVVFNRLEGSLLQHGRVWSGATVGLYSGLNYAQGPLVKQVTADGNGHFDFGNIAEGQYTLVASDGQDVKTSEPIVAFKDPRPLHTSVLIDYRQTTSDCKEMTRSYATTLIANKYLTPGE